MAMAEFRQDPVTGRWVIIAPGRAARPHQVAMTNASTDHETCPFCAGNESMTPPEVWALRNRDSAANTPGWRVRVVGNKYPAVDNRGATADRSDGFYRATTALGAHEVIIESPDHVVNLSALNTGQFENILHAYRARWRALARDRRWRHLMIYKNQGDRAGATLEHVHSQLIALPQAPPHAVDEQNGASQHFAATGRCIYCEIIQRELADGERLVAQSERFVALCPFAPRFGFETWILPRRHPAGFEETSDRDLVGFGETLRDFILKLARLFENPPFNYLLHSAPAAYRAAEYDHWHLEILPQITRAAGFEWGSGMHLNSVAPEEAARLLRGAAV
jgi:UDPglucose--hexose-1-phosphate uridylyltransferase